MHIPVVVVQCKIPDRSWADGLGTVVEEWSVTFARWGENDTGGGGNSTPGTSIMLWHFRALSYWMPHTQRECKGL